jgi:hypothetical protein
MVDAPGQFINFFCCKVKGNQDNTCVPSKIVYYIIKSRSKYFCGEPKD